MGTSPFNSSSGWFMSCEFVLPAFPPPPPPPAPTPSPSFSFEFSLQRQGAGWLPAKNGKVILRMLGPSQI